jgi:MFS family permease
MSEVTKVKIARILASSPFWMSIIVIYFNYRGVPLPEVYKIVSFYSICIVLFEYPTGVVGDYFSHKLSVALGYFISMLAMFLSTMRGGSIFYYGVLALLALGVSLVSGSDTALLHKVSTDFKKDASSLKSISMFWVLATIAIGGFLGKYSLILPIYFTAATYLLAFVVLLFVKENSKDISHEGNIFDKAKEGIIYIKDSKQLVTIILLNTLISAIFLSMKWVYNPFFEKLRIDIQWWGLLISFATVANILGVLLYKKTKNSNIILPFVTLIASFAFSALNSGVVPLSAFFFAHFIGGGFIETYFEVDINKHLKDSIRASVLSFTSLLIRLSSAIYIYVMGLIVAGYSLTTLFLFTTTLIAILGLPLLFKHAKDIKAGVAAE